MYQRINITLPTETIRLIDRIARKGNRSVMIDKAIRHYVRSVGRKTLREQIKEGAIARAERDLAIAEEWCMIGDD